MSDKIKAIIAPTYAERMARAILRTVEDGQREVSALREDGKNFTAEVREMAWKLEVSICEKTLVHMQDQIDAFTELEIERRMTTVTPPPIQVP